MGLTNRELAKGLADRVRQYRARMAVTQADLARRSGISLTSIARFERTGAITLNNLISLLRALGAADRLKDLIPDYEAPSPLELLRASKVPR